MSTFSSAVPSSGRDAEAPQELRRLHRLAPIEQQERDKALAPHRRLVPSKRERGWVIAAQEGDRAAFELLWNRYASTVHGILLAHVRAQEAHDLMQDVALAALHSIAGVREPERFPGWIASLARNRARDALRQRARPTACDPRELQAVAKVAPQHESEPFVSELERVQRALLEIPTCYREALILRLVEGLKGTEIARRTGRSAGSIRVHLHRGMKLLRERLEGRLQA